MAAANANNVNISEGAKKIPIYYGNPEKDTITAEMFLEQAQTVGETLGWDQATLCRNIYMALGGIAKIKAQQMKSKLDYVPHIDTYTELFQKYFTPKMAPGEVMGKFSSLKMKPNESVNEFETRVTEMARRAAEAADPFPFPEYSANYMEALNTDALRAEFEEKKQQIIRRVIEHQTEQNAFQMFMCYIANPYYDKLMEQRPKNLAEAYRIAANLEDLKQNNAKKFEIVSEVAVKQMDQPTPPTEATPTPQMDSYIDAIIKRTFFKAQQTQGNSDKPSKFCYYCKKRGHIQEDCHQRKRKGHACKDRNGRLYDVQPNGDRKYRNSGQSSGHNHLSTIQSDAPGFH